ncbi:MAG TPA: FAD-binding oxidoreductase [Acidobacteriaceae bacterium]|nr:FAD-binding oxidoreductase [Acidobacteriaceae bacterium]
MINTQDITAPLTAIAGAEHLRSLGSTIAVAPANSEEIAAILRFAQENRLNVVPYGGGTKQGWGYTVQPALLLEMHRLNVLREHTWQDMTCTVDAGCTWAAMQSGLAQHGQYVALDPLWPERATVGGIIATNDSGVLRLGYGGLRDLIIGMTIVLADGTVARTGGKVVKNVAGYDLHKLMIGAFGTLGVITSVNFRLHSMPQCTQGFTVAAPAAEPLGKLILKLLHAQVSTVAIQLRGTTTGFDLDIQLASLAEVLHTQAAALEAMAQSVGLSSRAVGGEVWNARQEQMDRDFVCKGTMLPSEIARFAEHVRGLGGESVTQATGIMIAGFPAASGERLVPLRRDMEEASGSLMVLKQPSEMKLDCWGTLPDSLPLMREIKRRFDPEGILNPGRFLGGI